VPSQFSAGRNDLSRAALRRGWSDGDLAARASLSCSRLNRIKNGRAVPTLREALLIAAALDCTIADLFFLPDADLDAEVAPSRPHVEAAAAGGDAPPTTTLSTTRRRR
jgi:transcriptional regulator with XRE-family HTH domain